MAVSVEGCDGFELDVLLLLVCVVGFVDMVFYMMFFWIMDDWMLVCMVLCFEFFVVEIILVGGGWFVKIIGDEVMFNVEIFEVGVVIVFFLVEIIVVDEELFLVCVVLIWGWVFFCMGDIYGFIVNFVVWLMFLVDLGIVFVDVMIVVVLFWDECFVFVL